MLNIKLSLSKWVCTHMFIVIGNLEKKWHKNYVLGATLGQVFLFHLI